MLCSMQEILLVDQVTFIGKKQEATLKISIPTKSGTDEYVTKNLYRDLGG